MTGFDLLLLGVFAVSIGFAVLRGAVREIGTLIALLFGVLMAWIFTDALLSAIGKEDFIATVGIAATLIAAGFIAAHIAITFFSGKIRLEGRAVLFDRIGGGVLGFIRAYALIGLAFIGYGYYLDADSRPDGVRNAALLPLASGAANVMRAFAPGDPLEDGAPALRNSEALRNSQAVPNTLPDIGNQATSGQIVSSEIGAADRRALNEIVATATTRDGASLDSAPRNATTPSTRDGDSARANDQQR